MKYLDLQTSKSELSDFLHQKGWLEANDEAILNIEKPGEGNMNVVLRVTTNKRSFILKQSRPFVQKYQQIEAPLDRIDVEHQFYTTINDVNIKTHIPNIIDYDPENHLLIMEDLGQCEDMVSIYQNKNIEDKDIEKLVQLLVIIHSKTTSEQYPQNLVLRQLNHQHIFILPFLEDNGFNLDDIQVGLQDLSLAYKKDAALKTIINNMGEQYLSKGNTLLHGDYYPGSWMKAADKLYIIDPEFSFIGFAEFDLGVMAAHLMMATLDDQYTNVIYDQYTLTVDRNLVHKIAGIEIMRRLIGLAQLPLSLTLSEKEHLLKMAKKMICS